MKKAMFLLLVYITYIQGYEMYEVTCQRRLGNVYSFGGYTLEGCVFRSNYPGHLINKNHKEFRIHNPTNVIELYIDMKDL